MNASQPVSTGVKAPVAKSSTGGNLSPFQKMRLDVDRLFDRFFQDAWDTRNWGLTSGDWAPALEVRETENTIQVRAELPDVDPKVIDIHVHDNVLTLRGKRETKNESDENGVHYSEMRYGSFHRTLPLTALVDADHVHAEYAKGVLTVDMKKVEAKKAKRINIQSAN